MDLLNPLGSAPLDIAELCSTRVSCRDSLEVTLDFCLTASSSISNQDLLDSVAKDTARSWRAFAATFFAFLAAIFVRNSVFPYLVMINLLFLVNLYF